MTNIAAARELVALVRALGADDVCVCAGSRNSPLLAVLGEGLRMEPASNRPPGGGGLPTEEHADRPAVFSFVDERSAAFFALGRIKLRGKPAAVVTTSGTAVAELLPATVEAHYGGLPLILITADRPARYHGTGAPQAIEQTGIFGVYAETNPATWSGARPLHLNIEFDEPLIDDELQVAGRGGERGEEKRGTVPAGSPRRLSTQHSALSIQPDRLMVLIGGLAARDRDRVRDFALQLNAPVYAEPLSGLREDPVLERLLLRNERMLARGRFQHIIRIGGVPTLRFWRDLDEKLREIPLISFSALPFAGLSRGEVWPIEALPPGVVPCVRDEALFEEDRSLATRFGQILDDEPRSELAMLRTLASSIEPGARVYLGNSLPIREWDMVAPRDDRGFIIEANRGANGIDGQLSTFFGQCDPTRMNVAIVGDLTAVYDLNAPWIVPQLDPALRFRIVVLNNGGGRIFSRVTSLQAIAPEVRKGLIENDHALRFDDWARMWNIVEQVTELRPDLESSQRVWTRYDEMWSSVDGGRWTVDSGQWTVDEGVPATSSMPRETGADRQAANSEPPATGNGQPPTVSRQSSAKCRQPTTVNRQPSTVNRFTALHGFLGLPSDWNFLRDAGFDVRAIDTLHEPVPMHGDVLLGYSMGGRLALQALLGGARYRKAILVSTRIGDAEANRREHDEAWAGRFENEEWTALLRAWNGQTLFGGHFMERRQEDFDRAALARALREWSPAVLPSVASRIREIDIPTLWIAGERDVRYTAEAQQAADAMPNARVEIIAGAGHRVPWEESAAFIACVRDFSR
jgi:2-succinyl-5-enolpyruvyl-6-hydroxy-3-cyclohexene-1-carboxylate synthase